MQCTTCGTEIADNALICYRCGDAVADAGAGSSPGERPSPSGRSLRRAIVLIVLASLLCILAIFAAATWPRL